MKRIFTLSILTIAISLWMSVDVNAQSFSCSSGIYTNPEFESDYSSWTTSGTTSITSDAYFGSKAGYIAGGTSGGGFWQFTSASPGDQLEASVYGKVSGSCSAALGILFYDASYNILNAQYQTFTNTSYTEITISSVPAPANTAYVRVSGWKNSGSSGTATFDGFCVEPLAPPTPQPYFTCDSRFYQSIKIGSDYWLYEVQTDPVNLIPLVNLTAAGASGSLNSLVFSRDEGYMYVCQTTSPFNLYRIGSDFSVVNLGAISGFMSGAYINGADIDENGDIIYKSNHSDISLDLYKLDMSTMTVSLICDFPNYPGHRNNIGDIAVNPLNGLYYGTWDSTSILIEMDPSTCTINEIATDRWFPGANGAFWISADGVGYGYENATGNLSTINLSTGAVEIIGSGSATSQTDGCSCSALEVNKTVNVDTTVAGDTITYTYTVFNNWNTHLSTVTFTDTFCTGMSCIGEPFDLTGGILLDTTNISGNNIAGFTIDHLPQGMCSFKIRVSPQVPFGTSGNCNSQAHFGGLPARLGTPRISDDPVTPAVDDPTSLYVVSETDCIGTWNQASIVSNFDWDNLGVQVKVSRPLMNVVLEFSDGSHELIDGANTYNGSFAGTGANADKCVTGTWIRTACNASGDGPEYGQYFPNTFWDGFCISDGPPLIQPDFNHGSTVIFGGGPTNPVITSDVLTEFLEVNNSGGHNTSVTGIGRPDIPGNNGGDQTSEGDNPWGGFGHKDNFQLTETDVVVYPNPVRSTGSLNVSGLDDDDWNVHVYSVNGSHIASERLNIAGHLDISALQLKPGMYFLELENGMMSTSAKIIVQ